MSSCDCGSACSKCLKHYRNQYVHGMLDRFAALQLLEWGIEGIKASPISPEKQISMIRPLANILKQSGCEISTDGEITAIGHRSKKKIVIYPAMWVEPHASNTVFVSDAYIKYTENSFFTTEGRVTNEDAMRQTIYQQLEPFIVTGMSKKVDDIMKDLRIKAQVTGLLPQTDRVHVQNGTVFLDGSFIEAQNEIVRSRFPVRFNPKVKKPERWLKFLSELFWPEDIPTLQEFIGYCLIPSNAGQKMMVIKGSGGEGKSQIGHVLSRMFGPNAKDGSVGKISENPFARADLEHIHLMIDDDMRLEALKQTNYIKAIVTAKGKMDLERKGKQSYQGFMYARILAFSNGDLVSLYDRSDGFFRRQLILTTKRKPPDRIDDPNLSEKLCEEMEGIFLWAMAGLLRLVKNNFQFTESGRAKLNREMVKKDANNIELFLDCVYAR